MGRGGGGGGGGFSGGGFSGGFSGGHSSGGFSGGHSSGGFSGGRGGAFGGSPGGGGVPPPRMPYMGGWWLPRTIIVGGSTVYKDGGSNQQPPPQQPSSQPPAQPPKKKNSLTGAIIVLVSAVLLLIIAGIGSGTSTTQREKLASGLVQETGYYTDEVNWIHDSSKLTSGMKEFYQKTGVQPYLYLVDTVDGTHTPTSEQLAAFTTQKYSELFKDEAHFLLVFFEWEGNSGQYMAQYECGNAAKTVVDADAISILQNYVNRYYSDSSLSDEAMFSKVFSRTAEDMMDSGNNVFLVISILYFIFALAFFVFSVVQKARAQKAEEEEKRNQQINDMLKTPLETFGDTEAEKLAQKYADPATRNDTDSNSSK